MRLRIILAILVSGVFALWVPPTQASAIPELDCEAPIRPVNDQNDALWQAFLLEVDEFRSCTARYMEMHQAAVVEHQQGAKQAVAAWNEFVRTSLNAPQDFPWPPEDG